jgi:hypothetical protein
MSFDPHGSPDESPPPASGIPQGPPGQGIPPDGGVPPPDPEARLQRARERVTLPAIFLIVLGLINLLPAAFFTFQIFAMRSIPPEELRKRMIEVYPGYEKMLDDAAKQGKTMEDVKQSSENFLWGVVIGEFLAALLVIVGGIRMLQLRSYGLAVLSALLMAIPCVSGSACCGIGEIVALWSLYILLQVDVRAAFR